MCTDSKDIVIRQVTFEECSPLFSMRKESVAFGKSNKTKYWGAFVDGKIVGCVGMQELGNVVRYKTDAVLPAYRHRGIYSLLWKTREEGRALIASRRTTAFCTKMSLPCYIGHGFCISRINKNITFVERDETI